MHREIAFALAALAAGTAAAQDARPHPSSPQAKAAPVEYRSAFERYRAFVDEKPAGWRESNEAVKADTPASAKKPASRAPAPHGGHGGHN